MKTNNVIYFKNTDGSVAFAVKDDGSILIDEKEYTISYINDDYFLLDLKCYSHKSFYETFVETGHTVVGGKGTIIAEKAAARA